MILLGATANDPMVSWAIFESGGSETQAGTVVDENNTLTLREGDSALRCLGFRGQLGILFCVVRRKTDSTQEEYKNDDAGVAASAWISNCGLKWTTPLNSQPVIWRLGKRSTTSM